MRRKPLRHVATILLAAGLAASAQGAELRLRNRVEASAPVVTLGDVAEVLASRAGETDALVAIELFPAPAPGQRRYVTLREIEDLLVLRGVNTAPHRFAGAGQVEIVRPASAEQGARATTAVVRRAERLVREAVVRHLQQRVSGDEPWTVEVRIDESLATALSTAGDRLEVAGGSPPWTGEQRFEVTLEGPQGKTAVPVVARVALPPSVVVAARAIPRGSLVQAADLVLQRGAAGEEEQSGFRTIEEAVGREAVRAIPAGKAVLQEYVRSPILVRRGQAVTVHARAAGIHVRTTARARDDGGLGDLISVESLLDRKAFFARVCGIQEVEVYARAVAARQETLDTAVSEAREGR